MKNNDKDFWETIWQRRPAEDYRPYLSPYYKKQDPIVELFRQHGIRRVCDAACGFGAYEKGERFFALRK